VHDQDDVDHSETPAPPRRAYTRRLALGSVVTAAGAAIAAVATGTASAQTDTTGASAGSDASTPATGAPGGTTATGATTTTTLPPQRPTTADTALLGFVQTLELAAAELYSQALPTIPQAQREVPAAFLLNHENYGEQLGAMLGRRAPGIANATLVSERAAAFGARSIPAVLRAMYDLEDSLAASQAALLGELVGTDGAALIASILPIAARQAVVLGQSLNIADEVLMPLFEGDEPGATVLTPAQYPVA
jgi:hypothetical protein